MKFKLLSILFILCFMFSSAFAKTPEPTLLLNGIVYTSKHPVIIQDHTLFMTIEDFSLMTFASFEVEKNNYSLKAYNNEVTFNLSSRQYKKGSVSKLLNTAPFLSDKLIYIPIDLLEPLGYNYTYDVATTTLKLDLTTPYSRNIDHPENHSTKVSEKNLKVLPNHILAFNGSDSLQATLEQTINNKDYIAFVDNSHFKDVASYFKPKLNQSPYNNMYVTFRLLDTKVYPNKLVEATTYPVTVDMQSEAFNLQIGNEKLTYPSLWSTYYPARSLTDVDLNKSFDMTLMRAFYEYYRNTCDLRDDQYFSSFETLTNTRTNVFSHQAYSVALDGTETHYTIKIYRVHPTGSIHYLVDILKENTDKTSQ